MRFRLPFFSPAKKNPKGPYKGPYHLLSAAPPILHVVDWTLREKNHPVYAIFRALRKERAYFLIDRNLSRWFIRGRALAEMMAHRGRLVTFIQGLYDAEQVERSFAEDWKQVFRNYLLDPDTEHTEIIARIKQARRR